MKLSEENKRLILGLLILLALFLLGLAVLTAINTPRTNPYTEACTILCQNKEASNYAYYGYREPCNSNAWQDCIVCFCETNNTTTMYNYKEAIN